MKTWIIIILIVAVLSFTAFKVVKKGTDAEKMKFGIDSFKINVNSKMDVLLGLVSGYNSTVNAYVNNFSDSSFELEQLSLEIFALDGKTLIAEQTTPLKSSVILNPKGKTALSLDFHINTGGLLELLKQIGQNDIKATLEGYLKRKELGTQVIIKGFVQAEGFSLDINETMSI